MPARTLLLLAAMLGGSSMALPGQATTPQALGISVNVRASDVGRLTLIQRAVPSQVEVFQSRAGQQHLRFKASIDGQTYAAIMYSGDWTAADQARLGAGQVQLVGLWDTYANAPSLTVKKVLGGHPRRFHHLPGRPAPRRCSRSQARRSMLPTSRNTAARPRRCMLPTPSP